MRRARSRFPPKGFRFRFQMRCRSRGFRGAAEFNDVLHFKWDVSAAADHVHLADAPVVLAPFALQRLKRRGDSVLVKLPQAEMRLETVPVRINNGIGERAPQGSPQVLKAFVGVRANKELTVTPSVEVIQMIQRNGKRRHVFQRFGNQLGHVVKSAAFVAFKRVKEINVRHPSVEGAVVLGANRLNLGP